MDEIEIKKVVETLLFISDQPLPLERISQIVNLKENKIEKALETLKEDYTERTFQIMNVAGGYQMATRQEYSLWIRRLYNNRMTVRLSAAALETLSIIAYKQPITRAEVEAIRGVEVIGPLETLLERRLITTVGRKESVGRPLLYGTTKEFLRQFGLNSLDNLPDINTLVDQEATEAAEQAMAGKPSLAEEAMDGLSTLDIDKVEPTESEEIVVESSPVIEQASSDNPVVENEDNALEVEETKEEEQEDISLQNAVDEKLSEEVKEDGEKEEDSSSGDFDDKIGEAIAEIQEKKVDISDDESISPEDDSTDAEQAMADKSADTEQIMDEKPADIVGSSDDEDKE